MSQHEDRGLLFASARAGDSDAMRRLARTTYAVYVARIGREPAPMTSDYEAVAASGDALLVWRGEDLVGMLVTRLEENALLIENIAVSPDAQGSGLGSALLFEAERIARSKGRGEVRLYTNEAMTENLAFYLRRGFQETHRTIEDGYRRVHFAKQVGPTLAGGSTESLGTNDKCP